MKPRVLPRFASVLTAVVFLSCVSAAALAAASPTELTPRLSTLAAAPSAENVAAFWAEIETSGTPLIEPVEGKDDTWWVTFLYRDDDPDEPAGNVLVLGFGKGSEFTTEVMSRIEGTDVLYRTYTRGRGFRGSYQLSPNDPLTLPDMDDPEWWPRRFATFGPDPLNPKRFGDRYSIVELPGAPEQPWIVPNDQVSKGEVVHHEGFRSEVLDNKRPISVYLPPAYDASRAQAYPMFVVFDRGAYLNQVPTPTILDNLITAGEIPPLVAVLVGNSGSARNTELPCNPQFAEFLATELFPFVREGYHVTRDPAETVVGGSSFGGLASTYFALEHPELVGNVLSQSGSYWWADGWDFRHPDPAVEGEWLTRQYALRDKVDVRFYMDVGIHEAGNPSMAVVNRHLRNVLQAKGYDVVRYVEFNGGHDYLVWRGTLADGLIALLGETAGSASSP